MRKFGKPVAGALAGAGVMMLVGRRVRARNDVDPALIESVRTALAAAGDAGPGIAVTSRRGTVTLRGEVDQLVDIAAYEAVAREQPGVIDVDNLLRLRTPSAAH